MEEGFASSWEATVEPVADAAPSDPVPLKRTLEDVLDDDDDDDDDDFDDDKPVKKQRMDEDYESVENTVADEADGDAPSEEASEEMDVDDSAPVEEEERTIEPSTEDAVEEEDQSIEVVEEDSAEGSAEQTTTATEVVDEPMIGEADGQVDGNEEEVVVPVPSPADVEETPVAQTDAPVPSPVEVEETPLEQTDVPSEVSATDPLDAFLNSSRDASSAAVDAVEGSTGSTPEIQDILAAIGVAFPSIELDTQHIVGELNGLSVSDAVAVLTSFQHTLAAQTDEPPDLSLLQDLIAHQVGQTSLSKETTTDTATTETTGEEQRNSSSSSSTSPAGDNAGDSASSVAPSGQEQHKDQGAHAVAPPSVAVVPEPEPASISDAIWTRLLDCQNNPLAEFHISQLRPYTLDALSVLPEFAQLAIVARFARSPLGTVRNKDSLLMQTMDDYRRENPMLEKLQSVSQLMAGATSDDDGLFAYGYAPPQPTTGMVRDPPRRLYNLANEIKKHHEKFMLDEFGRAKTSGGPSSSHSHSRGGPRHHSTYQHSSGPLPPSSSSSSMHHGQDGGGGYRRQDPSPRHQGHHQAAGGGMAPPPYHNRPQPGGGAPLVDEFHRSEIYHRLPIPIRDALAALYAKGHVKELLNDSVLSRLLKLPEHLAVRAVENFINTDASHVDNIHGFFVGIITRVYERDRGPPPAVAPPMMMGGGDRRDGGMMMDPYGRHDMQMMHGGGGGGGAGVPIQWSKSAVHDQYIRALSPTVQAQLQHMAATGVMTSIDEWGEKCYEILGQLSETLAIEVLKRFTMANLESVRNRSGFLIGVVKRCRQEYGMPN
ncbi:Aste57867_3944 [Aphanomyces stellatus]|uniref:Aste57867_3944 protein n=1 Tax=Aphanomyces stellatus TaxID=120398 RepID=A0A485KD11_9STRA|nr:hypothetical protein As57867_003933 [Aphanomyces stellatus]VFT81081.1 Aste57867_3944 [Aphanomyces stellatus]